MRKSIRRIKAACLVLVTAAAGMLGAETASVMLQQGIFAEETEGDLKQAAGIYRKVLAEENGLRPLAAQAQYRLALCLQKQGMKDEAVSAFREVTARFPEERELLLRARQELASLGAMTPDTGLGLPI